MKELMRHILSHIYIGEDIGEVVEIVGGYAFQKVFASCCDKSAAPLGMFGVIVSSSYESIA